MLSGIQNHFLNHYLIRYTLCFTIVIRLIVFCSTDGLSLKKKELIFSLILYNFSRKIFYLNLIYCTSIDKKKHIEIKSKYLLKNLTL